MQIPSWGGLGGVGTLGLRVGPAILGVVGAAVLLVACRGTEQSVLPAETAPPASTETASTPVPAQPTPPAPIEAFVGSTDDITWRVVEIMGSIPSTETMTALGHLGGRRPSCLMRERGHRRFQWSRGRSSAIWEEITLDVVGLADDSILGYRLHIFAHPPEAEGGFTLKTVERTLDAVPTRGERRSMPLTSNRDTRHPRGAQRAIGHLDRAPAGGLPQTQIGSLPSCCWGHSPSSARASWNLSMGQTWMPSSVWNSWGPV